MNHCRTRNLPAYAFALMPGALTYIYRAWLVHLDSALLCIIAPVVLGAHLVLVTMVFFSKDLLMIGLGPKEGKEAYAVIKASSVMVAVE